MEQYKDIQNFFVVGLNFRKADASVRSLFSINHEQQKILSQNAQSYQVSSFFVLSTCNRTEIFGFAPSSTHLIHFLFSIWPNNNVQLFTDKAYIKNGIAAVEHMMSVAAGLDSQIIGDYEIIGQLKTAAKTAKQSSMLCPYLERMVNEVLATAKQVRAQTALSSGTVSVSYAAVQYALQYFEPQKQKKVLIIGTGKIGSNTLKNMLDYLPNADVTITNRSWNKAQELAQTYHLQALPFGSALENLADYNIIVVATQSDTALLLPQHFANTQNPTLVLDLSVPTNVDAGVAELPLIHLANIDVLSKITDATLATRLAEVPKAEEIIKKHLDFFNLWLQSRKQAPTLKKLKHALQHLQQEHVLISNCLENTSNKTSSHVQKIINNTAKELQQNKKAGCFYLEAVNNLIQHQEVQA